jgi:plastocyanin
VLLLVSLAAAGIGAGVFASSGGARPAASDRADATTRVRVVATEFKFALSRRTVPTGTVIFTVVNRGKIAHDFRIAGKKTRILAPGKSQVLRVAISRKGRYAYLCTLAGHAAAGMKGTLTVGATAAPTTTTGTTTTTPTTTVTGPATTITVDMFEYRFALSQDSVPSGTVTFVITNRGREVHNFSITGVKVGTILGPAQTETYTVGLPPRGYEYVCDVPFHIGFGMVGQLNVT